MFAVGRNIAIAVAPGDFAGEQLLDRDELVAVEAAIADAEPP